MRLSEIAGLLGGRVLGGLEGGGGDTAITGAAGISEAKGGDITFLSGPKYLKALKGSGASAVLVKEEVPGLDMPQVIVPDPYYSYAKILEVFYVRPHAPLGVSPLAFVSKDAEIGDGASIYPFSYISPGASIGKRSVIYPGAFIGEGSKIGEDSVVHPNAVVREGVSVGDRVIIHAGAAVGSDGFGYTFHGGRHYKVPQVGGVIIGDDVEVGAGVTIDRATTGNTVIGKGTKIDNLVQVGHNVTVGENSIIVAQVGIGGSTEIGGFVTIGGQVGIADHARIEGGTMIAAQSGVMGELEKGVYSGTPTMPHSVWLKAVSLFQRLPEFLKRIRALEDKVDKLSKEASDD